MSRFAKLLLLAGIMLMVVSIPLGIINEQGSPEGIISWINVGLGALMTAVAVLYLAKKKDK
ncbi:MAG: hypothetical protein RSC08_01400 [Oscillospiraceae bacterium]